MMENISNEELLQKVHELEKALCLTSSLKCSMQQDIDSLLAQLENNQSNFCDKQKRIETELNNKWTEKINLLKSEFDEEKQNSAVIIEDLNKRINELENQKVKDYDNVIDDNILEQLNKVQDQNVKLKEQVDELDLLLENSKQEQTQLNETIKNLEIRNEEILQALEIKKEALFQSTEALNELQEEKAMMANELAVLKAGPVDEKRKGNSLFAEVDDNRQILIRNISILKQKLNEVKFTLQNKNLEISGLKRDNEKLHRELNEIDRFVKPEQLKFIEAYKERINELELIVDNVRSTKLPNIASSKEHQCFQWVFDSLEKTRTEHQNLVQEYNQLSKQRLAEVEQLTAALQEIRKLKADISLVKSELQLKIKNEEKPKFEEAENNENVNLNVINSDDILSTKRQSKAVRFAEVN